MKVAKLLFDSFMRASNVLRARPRTCATEGSSKATVLETLEIHCMFAEPSGDKTKCPHRKGFSEATAHASRKAVDGDIPRGRGGG